jgi:predicted GH43/DUF377 family glycosyl hydrolase
MDEAEVERVLSDVMEKFSSRHDDLAAVFADHAQRVSDFVEEPISANRRQLLGAAFTHEYSLEGSAVCNPSLVAHPDQTGVTPGGLRVIMSLRAIGEGHLSTICFRVGEIGVDQSINIESPLPFPVLATTSPGPLNREVFRAALRDMGLDGETASTVLDRLPPKFSRKQLGESLEQLGTQSEFRVNVAEMADLLRSFTKDFYSATFRAESDLSQRTLWPAMLRESQGMEDARFVEFIDENCARYIASYTAYNGRVVSQQLLETDDFVTFDSSPLVGVGAQNKGLAFFPRKIGHRYVALSRYDREHNAIAFSSDLHHWGEVSNLDMPVQSWEMLQVGNCGSPIELEQGWLVLTHGVGPMRTYGIGAMLLDLEDPRIVIGTLKGPLLAPSPQNRDGYVPNVVYSCGSIVHKGVLFLPFGASDQSIGCATVEVNDLVQELTA